MFVYEGDDGSNLIYTSRINPSTILQTKRFPDSLTLSITGRNMSDFIFGSKKVIQFPLSFLIVDSRYVPAKNGKKAKAMLKNMRICNLKSGPL